MQLQKTIPCIPQDLEVVRKINKEKRLAQEQELAQHRVQQEHNIQAAVSACGKRKRKTSGRMQKYAEAALPSFVPGRFQHGSH